MPLGGWKMNAVTRKDPLSWLSMKLKKSSISSKIHVCRGIWCNSITNSLNSVDLVSLTMALKTPIVVSLERLCATSLSAVAKLQVEIKYENVRWNQLNLFSLLKKCFLHTDCHLGWIFYAVKFILVQQFRVHREQYVETGNYDKGFEQHFSLLFFRVRLKTSVNLHFLQLKCEKLRAFKAFWVNFSGSKLYGKIRAYQISVSKWQIICNWRIKSSTQSSANCWWNFN